MKKLILALFVLLSTSLMVKAQVQLTAYTGYQFGSRTYLYNYGDFKVKSSQDFAGMLSFEIGPSRHIELSYTYIPTSAFVERHGIIDENVGDVDIHYYQIGGVHDLPVSDVIDLFGTFTLGGTTFTSDNKFYQNHTFFSFTAGGGVKIWLTDVIGIRLQARLLMPITWGGFTIGTGGAGFTTGSSIISGDVGGGLVFRFGN